MARVAGSEKVLATALMEAATMGDVERIIEMAEQLYGPLSTRPVGDRPNNIGTVRLGSDPALGIVERCTNGMDDILDLGRAEHATDVMPTSPREAAKAWLGVPRGGIAEMTDAERRALGERLQVWLDESGEDKRPTVVISDDGLGQHPAVFPKTLLSLNETNKVAQPWNMGTYGQGGAVTFGWSRATIIISRRHPNHLDGRDDRVGWTIVREYENDPGLQMLPSYKYVVASSNEVPELDPALFDDLPHGTRVIHVGYDLQGWTGPFTTGLWQFFHSALFDPVIPFLITGKRKKERNYGSRIVIGNAARLARPDRARGDVDVAHTDSVRLDLGAKYGSVTFNYWVLRREAGSTSTSDPAASYARADSAVSMTLFGQRQDTEPRSWINNQAKLPFLYKNMVVQIDADALTPIAKREIFASTRERATKSEMRAVVYEALATTLRSDDELKRLNYEEKERLLQRSTSASSEKVQKRLAKFIKTRLQNVTRVGKGGARSGTAPGTTTKPPGGPSKPRDTSDEHLHNVPTKLEILRDTLRINQGSKGYSWVEIDAKNGYLPTHDDDLTLVWDEDPGDSLKLTMRSMLLGGKSRWLFDVAPDAAPGEYTFRASLLTEHGVLTDTVVVEVVVPKPVVPTDKGTEPETGPRVQWVYREDWGEHQGRMNARAVGYVTTDDDETIIWVNRHYRLLDAALSGRNLTAEQIDTRATRYQFPVACALWLQNDALTRTEPKPSDQYLSDELERMAEAVLVAADPDVDAALEESED